jgi:heptosyltransferase-2
MHKTKDRYLLIQTASIGDVVLITPVIESIHRYDPDAEIFILINTRAAELFDNHPFISKVFIWNKKNRKYQHLWHLIFQLRKYNFTAVINFQRYFSTGFLMWCMHSNKKITFKQSTMSCLFANETYEHLWNQKHEVDRNLILIQNIVNNKDLIRRPQLYIPENIKVDLPQNPYICISPFSLWNTKQMVIWRWVALCESLINLGYNVAVLGGKEDINKNKLFFKEFQNNEHIYDFVGKLSLLETLYVIKHSFITYSNDSAITHLASSINAPIATIFCSTVPSFGFTPLSDKSFIIEPNIELLCRPCGKHGYSKCPKNLFICGNSFNIEQLLEPVKQLQSDVQ